MQSLSDLLDQTDTVQTLRARTKARMKWIEQGWFPLSNSLVADLSVSSGAFRLYCLLMRRLFNKDFCFPGQEKLAEELGVSARQVKRLIIELKAAGWIKIERRGLGKTNVYYLMKE